MLVIQLFFSLIFPSAHSTIFYEFHDLGWRASENEIRVQVTQNFLRQEGQHTNPPFQISTQLQTQKLILNYGLTDRFDLYAETTYQSKFVTKDELTTLDNDKGGMSPAFGFSYRIIEEYPAFCNFDIALSFSPKTKAIELGERRNFYNGGNITKLLLLVNKKLTEKHELQLSYNYTNNSEKELQFYFVPTTATPGTMSSFSEHAIQFIHNYKFKTSYALLSSLLLDYNGSKTIKIPSLPSTTHDLSSTALSLASGVRWNISDIHILSFLIGAKWHSTLISEINAGPDEKTRDQKSEFIQFQYSFAHQFF